MVEEHVEYNALSTVQHHIFDNLYNKYIIASVSKERRKETV